MSNFGNLVGLGLIAGGAYYLFSGEKKPAAGRTSEQGPSSKKKKPSEPVSALTFARNAPIPQNEKPARRTVRARYDQIAAQYGRPTAAVDPYKTAFAWRTHTANGKGFAEIYDFRQTSVSEDGLPTPEEVKAGKVITWTVDAWGPNKEEAVDHIVKTIRRMAKRLQSRHR